MKTWTCLGEKTLKLFEGDHNRPFNFFFSRISDPGLHVKEQSSRYLELPSLPQGIAPRGPALCLTLM